MLREELGDGEGSLKYARRMVQLEPGWENGHHSLANALVKLGRLEQAKPAFEKALSINPNFTAAHSNYGACLLRLGLEKAAEHSYRQALHLEPTHTLTKFRLASFLSLSSKHQKDHTHLKEAEKL